LRQLTHVLRSPIGAGRRHKQSDKKRKHEQSGAA
jgi:hypothetical protein